MHKPYGRPETYSESANIILSMPWLVLVPICNLECSHTISDPTPKGIENP